LHDNPQTSPDESPEALITEHNYHGGIRAQRQMDKNSTKEASWLQGTDFFEPRANVKLLIRKCL
jgi:hypothetical protein